MHCICTYVYKTYLVPDWSSESSDDGCEEVERVLIAVRVGVVEVVSVIVTVTALVVNENSCKVFVAI